MPGLLLAVLDLAAVLAAAVLVLAVWLRASRGPRAWLVVLGATTGYVLLANVIVRLVPYAPSTYVLMLSYGISDKLTGGDPNVPLQGRGTASLLLASWLVASAVPTAVSLLLRFTARRGEEGGDMNEHS
ncbi:MAG TPA: hypothetical protein VLS93_08470 [Anaeromyxobacteraceae bacterium]|nr:hypothetical protein [Anaeromyxobacteraceae bacterium]